MFKKILCPTDGSFHAYKALDLAIGLAKQYHAELVILHVPHRFENIAALRRFAEVEGLAPHIHEEIDRLKKMDHRISAATDFAYHDAVVSPRTMIEIGHHIIEGAKIRAERKGLKNVDARVEVGDPAERILKCIDADNIDCVIMGSRGLNDLKGLFLGSVSHKVANRAPCTCISVK